MANTHSAPLPALTASGFEALQVTAATNVGVAAGMTSGTIVTVSMSQGMAMACTMSYGTVVNAVMLTGLEITDAESLSLAVVAVMDTLIAVGHVLPTISAEELAEVWVVNMDTKAVSRYADFTFNSYGMLHGHYIAAKEDGIYALDDAEVPHYLIDLGTLNFGSAKLKRFPNVYVGISATNDVYLRVIDGDQTYTYKARRIDTELATQRFDLGKGLRATHLDFELYGSGETDFADIEFLVLETARRI